MCLRFQFCTHQRVCILHFLKKKSNSLYPIADPDVYPGSRILIFTHPGSRIQKQQQKRGMKKISCLLTFFCSYKFHIIENYFILEMLKKKIWANFQRNYRTFYAKNLSLSSQKYGFGIRDPEKTYS
jgi:hypothetical protein